jgi:long-chain acyl-CoA synthetase
MNEMTNCRTVPNFINHIRQYDGSAVTDAASGQSYTYQGLIAEVEKISAHLEIARGDRVALYDIAPLDWIVLFFAITRRGGIAVPIDTRVHVSFIKDACSLTKPILVITNSKEKIPQGTYRVMTMEEIQATPSVAMALSTVNPNDPLEIVFTSGTWSAPKGVTLSHRNIMANLRQLQSRYSFAGRNASLLILPLSHAYAQMVGLLNPLSEGRHVVILNQINSIALPQAIKKYSVASIPVVPKVLMLLHNAILKKLGSPTKKRLFLWTVKYSLLLPRSVRAVVFHKVHASLGETLQTLLVGGALLDKKSDDFFRGLGFEVLIGYGLSECAPVVSICLDEEREEGCIGHLIDGVEGYLNENNELCVKGENVFLGYWPDVRKEEFFCTGDMFRQNQRGEYILSGRSKNLIVFPSGDKIFSEDIESIFRKLSGTDDVCAVNVGVDASPRIICAIPEDEPLSDTPASLKEKLNAHLPSGIAVVDIVILKKDSYIHTHTLKPNRKRILEEVLKLEQGKTNAHTAS